MHATPVVDDMPKTNAKLGDQIGVSYWGAKSKYGATIKDALDFVLHKGPGKEDITDIFPLVAAIAAAYGDPNGSYNAFLRRNDKRYGQAPYYFYDQAAAFTKAPTSTRQNSGGKESGDPPTAEQLSTTSTSSAPVVSFAEPSSSARVSSSVVSQTSRSSHSAGGATILLPSVARAAAPTPTIPFECPAAFATETEVELDDGVYVSCDQLKPFYGYADAVMNGA